MPSGSMPRLRSPSQQTSGTAEQQVELDCPTSCRSLRTLYRTCGSIARMSLSGAMLGRPPVMSASYIVENFSFILTSGLVDPGAGRTQRMVSRHEVLELHRRKQALVVGVGSSQRRLFPRRSRTRSSFSSEDR